MLAHGAARNTGAKKQSGFGAGIVAGASDNDPTTVATLAVIGSTTVYGLAWLTLLIIPMLAVIQAVAAQVGAVSKKGLEQCVRARYGRFWAFAALFALLVVNLLTLAADIEGGSAALQLITHVDYRWWLIPLGAGTATLLVFANYHNIERVLRYVSLLFLTYVGAAILAKPHWPTVLRDSLIPQFHYTPAYVAGALALLGTTLTAYAYVWETIEEEEEKPAIGSLRLVQLDAALGIVVAGVIFWFILVATGATLGVHHHVVQTASDAAEALAPLAGRYAALIFAIGLLSSAFIALPVLAGTSAFCVAEMFGWRRSLDLSFKRARSFYMTLVGCVLVATLIALLGVAPIQLLFYSGIAGGIATPFTMALMLLVARDRTIMKAHRIGPWLAGAGWAVTALVTAATVVYLFQTITGAGGG